MSTSVRRGGRAAFRVWCWNSPALARIATTASRNTDRGGHRASRLGDVQRGTGLLHEDTADADGGREDSPHGQEERWEAERASLRYSEARSVRIGVSFLDELEEEVLKRGGGALGDEVAHGAVGDEPAVVDDDDVVDGLG